MRLGSSSTWPILLAAISIGIAFAVAAENQPELSPDGISGANGKFAGALQLNGAGDYLDCGNNKSYDLSGALTIEAWVKRKGSAPWCKIVAKGCDKSYAIDTGSTGDSLRFVLMNAAGAAFVNLQADQVLPENTWTHVAATWDEKGLARILVNGKEIKRAEVAAHAIRVVDAPLCIGNDSEKRASAFEGLIDEVRISKSCRQAFELSTENVADADTVLLLPLNEVQEAANASGGAAAEKPNFQVPFSIELIGDPHGERGVRLKSVNPGPAGYGAILEGTLRRREPGPAPIWRLMQAYSKQSIASVEPLALPAGQKKWADACKEFILGQGTPDADFVLAVNSIEEYGNQYRSANAPWPNFLLEQDICAPGGHLAEAGPSLADCASMTLHVSAQLRYANNLHERGRGYSEGLHAAQFQLFFTLLNLNRQSPGYNKEYVWFGIPFYDDRFPVISPCYMNDGTGQEDESKGEKLGTGRFINLVGTKPFAEQGLIPGEWMNIHTNILPLMVAALERAWSRGLCNSSTNLADYKIGSMNIGWEVPGLSSVSAQIKDLSLQASGPQPSAGAVANKTPCRVGVYYFGMWSPTAFEVIDGFPFKRRDFYLRAETKMQPVYADDGKRITGYVPQGSVHRDDWWMGVRDLADKERCWPANPADVTDAYLALRSGDFSHLQPVIGYYDLAKPETIRQHIAQARAYGLEFFNFYWFWNAYTRDEEFNTGLEQFLGVPENPMKFALSICQHGGPFVLWGNEESAARHGNGPSHFDVVIGKLVGYVKRDNYLRTSDGRPIIYLLDVAGIVNEKTDAKGQVVGLFEPQGNTIERFLTMLRSEVLKATGHSPLLVMGATERAYPHQKPDGGTGTVSALAFADAVTRLAPSRGNDQLREDQQKFGLPVMPGFTQNFDERPRYGCIKDPPCLYDPTDSFRINFQRDLALLKAWMDEQSREESRILSIYAWNEWHEGGIIEPNVHDGARYLDTINGVFHLPRNPCDTSLLDKR